MEYKTVVWPLLEYAGDAWRPHTSILKSKNEKVQRYEAHFIASNYKRTGSVTEMLDSLELESLEDRHNMGRVKLFSLL